MSKYFLFFASFLFFIDCSTNENLANCIRPVQVSITSDLNNPQLIGALVPGGFANITGGLKGIVLLNVNGSDFVAYDKICPVNDCSTPMTLINSNILKCSCDNSEYGLGKGIGGEPQTPGFTCPALEYRVIKNGNAIQITNF